MSVTPGTLSKFLKILRESNNSDEKWSALTYIASCAGKGLAKSMTKVQYTELCTLLINMITSCDSIEDNNVAKLFNTILKDFANHEAILFQLALQINNKDRLKLFEVLKHADATVLSHTATDHDAVKFLNDCLQGVNPESMDWLAKDQGLNDIEILNKAETKILSANEEIDQLLVIYVIELLQRLYNSTPPTATLKISQFHLVVLDKIGTLAYMGTSKQREPALKLLRTAVNMNLVNYIKENHSNSWTKFKTKLHDIFSRRMTLLVIHKYLIWSELWSLTIQMLGIEAHKNSALINELLCVEEKAFKSSETEVRRRAFLCWKDLIDNFALNPEEFKIAKRVKLLCIPLNAKNSKLELIAVTKLEVWWHLILTMFSKQTTQHINSVIVQFLNFCFGPLGDTPLLSKKQNLLASPGKIFYETKLLGIDALLQMLVMKEEDRNFINPVLKERLKTAITVELFEESHKSYLHSVSEAVIMISNLTENDIKNRNKLITILWTNLEHYILQSSGEKKADILKECILVTDEMITHTGESQMIRGLILDLIIPQLVKVSDQLMYTDNTLIDLLTKLMTPSILTKIERKSIDDIRVLIVQAIKPSDVSKYHSNILPFVRKIIDDLAAALSKNCPPGPIMDFWCIIADLMTRYMSDDQPINEGTEVSHNLTTLHNIVNFPFKHNISYAPLQMNVIIKNWKQLYRQFDLQADRIPSVKHNLILNTTAKIMTDALARNEDYFIILAQCLKSLMETINYERLPITGQIPALVYLLRDITILSIKKNQSYEAELAIKSMDAFLISVYGFNNAHRTLLYLDVMKSAVEIMLSQKIPESIEREVLTTWEHVTIIIQGSTEALTAKMITSFGRMIILARCHKDPLISARAGSLLQFQKDMKEDVKLVLISIEKEAQLTKNEDGRDVNLTSSTGNKITKPVKVVGSFLGKTIDVVKTPKSTEGKREAKKVIPLPPDADSQEYVTIKSDPKFDVNKLTEHQKECFKRRREDLAMFNDTSQSASTHTEDLQEWFEKSRMKNDSNKENNSTTVDTSSKLDEQTSNKVVTNKLESFNKDNKQTEIKSNKGAEIKEISPMDEDVDNHEAGASSVSQTIVKKLDFESREEFPDEKGTDRSQTNSSSIDGKKVRRKAGRPKKSNLDQPDIIENRQLKRKADSDNESEVVERKRTRKSREDTSDNDADSHSDGQSQSDGGKLSDHTRREISRLKIDMVADFVFPTVRGRRRSKTNKSDESDDRNLKSRNLRSGDKEIFENEQSQELVKKRRRRSARSAEPDGGKTEDTSPNRSMKRLSTDSKDHKLNSSTDSDDKSIESMQNDDEDGDAKITDVNAPPEVSDHDEVVESSQEPTVLRSPQRRLGERRTDSPQSSPTTSRIMPRKSTVSEPSKNNSQDVNETFIDENKIPQEEKTEEPKKITITNLGAQVPVAIIVATTSSPQNAQKRFVNKIKTQGLSPHGRGAHMLGLIPSAAPLNRDKSDEDNNKKDVEISGLQKSKPSFILRHDKVSSPSGSRQEKIFNNMKGAELFSPSQVAFGNLKNDGEKVSPKKDKIQEVASMDHDYVEQLKEVEVNAIQRELPILEWSSANPPSLTASPSFGILKRHKSLPVECGEGDVTPKRKRVSFADPPVSKQMGYEVVMSPSTSNRTGLVRSIGRRDTPLRLKPQRARTIITIQEVPSVLDKEHESLTEVDLQRQKDNELLAKIADDLEEDDDVNLDSDTDDNQEEILENFATQPDTNQHNFSDTRTISQSSPTTASQSFVPSAEPETNTDTENNNFKAPTTPSKLNVTDDSILGKILIESTDPKRVELEETVDIQGTSTLNTSEIPEIPESFSMNKMQRTSTQLAAARAIAEADTLPLPDSTLSSQIMSQCSQQTQNSINLPVLEHLDSVIPICHTLVGCEEPLTCIISKLTNPLWLQHLTNWFNDRNITTIGHLAAMAEKDVAAMPIKGHPKIAYVKDILEKFAKEYISKLDRDKSLLSPTTAQIPSSSTSTPTGSHDESMEIIEETIEVASHGKDDEDTLSNNEDMTASISHNSSDNSKNQMEIDSIQTQHGVNDYGSIILDSTISPPAKTSTGMEPNRSMINAYYEKSSTIELKAIMDKMKKEKNYDHEVVKVLGSEKMLKAACLVLGINNVIPKLSEIYENNSSEFYSTLLSTYGKKIMSDQIKEYLDMAEIKQSLREKCTSSEISELLLNVLEDESQKQIPTSLQEVAARLPVLMKRIPQDLIIKHIISNTEVISPSILLDIGLQNNKPETAAEKVLSQCPDLVNIVMKTRGGSNNELDNKCKSKKMSHEQWNSMFHDAAEQMNPDELLDAFNQAMKKKIHK